MAGCIPFRYLLGLGLAALLLVGCGGQVPSGFVRLENGRFHVDGKPFFPIAVNYVMHLQFNDSACWAAPFRNYEREDRFRYQTKDSTHRLIKAEFELIRKLGFNTVRITSLASDMKLQGDSLYPWLPAQYGWGKDSLYPLNGDRVEHYFDAVDDMVLLAEETGLKLIILVKLFPGEPSYLRQALKLVDRLRDRPGVLAYDFFNEPLYFDVHDRPKREVHELVKQWQKRFKAHGPNQLTTIGLVGVPEVFAWDPNVLAVDFVSFHPYEYEPNQVMSEIHWYGKHVDKPWIVGETSLPADNDSVPYAEQLSFAHRTLAQTVACGGQGYSWWQFKDVKWGRFHSDYMGVLSMAGETQVAPDLPMVHGTVKPVWQAFSTFDPTAPPGPCIVPDNYYNFSSLTGAKLTGKLLDRDRRPIEGGVIHGWNEHWTRSYYTKSKADGSFELFGDFRFHHWMASATRCSMVRGDCDPNAFYTGADSIPAYYLGELTLEDLHLGE
ncbi:MAG: hypothetical protein JST41_06690 [Bacteroidetes bacterium]|jgi:hypothetical protein|nr:hypothetical protein [Bacteroidota bacterium]MCC6655665.1 hypothetical protein [Flavobacteriales bacterium]HMU13490.1 hypothetical protein [Flavobacteriales bacterium]HMZ47717.1 hypothetical protein [Flavobacteriales bacterium]HNK83598.1 hypothetical protein [Flavobacteriales bacterium]